MPHETSVQATICDRLDRAIAIIVHNGHKPASIFLTKADHDELSAHETRLHRERSGSTAFVWPCSYDDVPIITAKLIEHYEVPVRQSQPAPKRSTVYGTNGVGVPIDLV